MLECVVFFSGALVMILELVGSRVLAPYLGTSLIVWTSLIGVVLAFLALGAWFGGRLADRLLSQRRLSVILAGAGVSTLVTAVVHSYVGQAVTAAISGLHLATVVAACLLLAVPALFFGMVSPYVIRLRLHDLKTSGQTVGRLYALSTAGSIVGTFLGGFVLISWCSSTTILIGVAAGMGLLALLVRPRVRSVGSLALLLVLGVSITLQFQPPQIRPGNWEVVETPYNTLTIMEGFLDNPTRRMRFVSTDPGSCQSAIFIDAPQELALSYTHFYALGPYIHPQAQRVLMLGGGGYSVPRWLLGGGSALNPDTLKLDVVEIDPGMTRTARERFTLPDDARMTIHHQDARTFLNHNTDAYDLVFVDVFGSYYSVPFHIGTVEAMAQLRRAVAPGGAVIMNIIASLGGDSGRLFEAIHGAISANFAEVHVFGVRGVQDREHMQNIMVLALPEARPDLAPLLITHTSDVPGEAKTVPHMLARRVSWPIVPTVPPLTDEYAPVERYILSVLAERS